MLPSLYLVAEDELGLAVGRKLISESPPLEVYSERNEGGFGQLKTKTPKYQQMALRGFPVLMLTDLDHDPCPAFKIQNWLGVPPLPGFLFRVCVKEVEAWLLAHRDGLASFLGVAASLVPNQPESLNDPKRVMIALGQRSRRRAIRLGFTPLGSATIGPDYNQLLSRFVRECWDLQIASASAPSLKRTRNRVHELACTVSP